MNHPFNDNADEQEAKIFATAILKSRGMTAPVKEHFRNPHFYLLAMGQWNDRLDKIKVEHNLT